MQYLVNKARLETSSAIACGCHICSILPSTDQHLQITTPLSRRLSLSCTATAAFVQGLHSPELKFTWSKMGDSAAALAGLSVLKDLSTSSVCVSTSLTILSTEAVTICVPSMYSCISLISLSWSCASSFTLPVCNTPFLHSVNTYERLFQGLVWCVDVNAAPTRH